MERIRLLLTTIAVLMLFFAQPSIAGNEQSGGFQMPNADGLKQVPNWINDGAANLRDKMYQQFGHSGEQGQEPNLSSNSTQNKTDWFSFLQQLYQLRQSISQFFHDANEKMNQVATEFRDGANYLLDQLDSLANWTQRQVANARNYL